MRRTLQRLAASPDAVVGLGKVGGAGSAATIVVVTSLALTPSARGQFAAVIAGGNLAAVVGSLSLWMGISIVLARRADLLPTVVGLSLLLPLGIPAVLVPSAIALGAGAQTALAVGAIAFVSGAYSLLQGVPVGIGAMRDYGYAEVVRGVISAAAVTIGVCTAAASPSLLAYLWTIGAIAASIFLYWRGGGVRLTFRGARTILREAVPPSLRSHLTNVVGAAVFRLDIVLLALLSTNSQVAYYSLAVAASETTWLLPSALGLTHFSSLVRVDDVGAWARTARRIPRAVALAAATGVCVFGLGASAILVIFPAPYRASMVPLAICLAGTVLFSASHIVTPYIIATERRPALTAGIAVVSLAINMALLTLLAPRAGAWGAAAASAVAYFAAAILNVHVFARSRWRQSGLAITRT